METSITALKVGCGKFFYGDYVIHLLPGEIKRLGGNALIVGGTRSLDVFLQRAKPLLANTTYTIFPFENTCTAETAESFVQAAHNHGCNVLVAVGGGRCIDCVKCASTLSSLPIITIPTSIATCSATSMVAIMYDERGRRAPAVKLKKEIDVCIADADIIRTAPRRTLAAGILDSIAKFPESIHQKKIISHRDCKLVEYIQFINAKAISNFLLDEYKGIYKDYNASPLWNDFILTNLLHTSIVSGFADGSGQLAIAHALYDFIRNYYTEPGEAYLHGELVAIGLLVQMAFNGQPANEIDSVRTAMETMEMPLSLREIGYDVSEKSLDFLLRHLAADAGITTEKEVGLLWQAIREIT